MQKESDARLPEKTNVSEKAILVEVTSQANHLSVRYVGQDSKYALKHGEKCLLKSH